MLDHYMENTGLFCDARTVPESQIEQVLVAAINQAWCGKDTFLATLQKNIEAVLESEKGQPLTDVDKRLAKLQEELLKRTSARADYEDVAEEIYRLRDEKQKTLMESANRDEVKKRIANMGAFLQEQPTEITEYYEPLVRRLVEKVTAFEDRFTVEFKSGVTVDVEVSTPEKK